MSKNVTVTLTPAQAEVIHGALSMIENDPDWIDMIGGQRSMNTLNAGHNRLLAAMRGISWGAASAPAR